MAMWSVTQSEPNPSDSASVAIAIRASDVARGPDPGSMRPYSMPLTLLAGRPGMSCRKPREPFHRPAHETPRWCSAAEVRRCRTLLQARLLQRRNPPWYLAAFWPYQALGTIDMRPSHAGERPRAPLRRTYETRTRSVSRNRPARGPGVLKDSHQFSLPS